MSEYGLYSSDSVLIDTCEAVDYLAARHVFLERHGTLFGATVDVLEGQ